MLTEVPFEGFPKISRLSRDCVITEKIDGTNAQVYVSEDSSVVLAGSRSRWLRPDVDNFGFAKWVEANKEALLQLGPGRHFGEWYGAGIQRRYGLSDKRFALFNTERWDTSRPACCGIVPVLYSGPFSSGAVEEALARLARDGSLIAPGFMNPEGVVVWHEAARVLFKKTLDKDESPKRRVLGEGSV